MPTYEIEMNGQTFEIDAPDDKSVQLAIRQLQPTQPAAAEPSTWDTVKDVGGAFVAGAARGAADLVGFPATVGDGINAGLSYITGMEPLPESPLSGSSLRSKASDMTGGATDYKGEGTAAKYAGTIGEFVPGAVAFGGASLGNVARFGVLPGAASEAAGQATEGTAYEPFARAGAALLAPAASLAVPAIKSAGATIGAPLFARLNPEMYANKAVAEAVRRSGQTPDALVAAMEAAQRDGQGVYNVADALGNSGQRMLAGIARTPNDARQQVAEALISRQMDQGRRVASTLQDASGAPWTAEKYGDVLRSMRKAEADRLYAPVRTDTTAIDVSPAVAIANRSISPAADTVAKASQAVPTDLAARVGIEAGEAAIRDPIRQAVKEARSYMASNTNTVTNVEKAFRAKTNIDQMIATATEKGQGGVVDALTPIRNALDDALANTSKDYSAARDAYRISSQNIDAIDVGREMARPRTRVDDNLERFTALSPDQQQAARIGYFDPAIARAENTAGSMTNSARPFISESARRELPTFAEPGRGQQLMDRLGREQRMFETTSAALGGSKTADNLADLTDLARFDPSVLAKLGRGDLPGAAIDAARMLISEAKGAPPAVLQRVADTLMATDPQAAGDLLVRALSRPEAMRLVDPRYAGIVEELVSRERARLTGKSR